MRLLLVEDDVDLAELLAAQLTRAGFEVRLAFRLAEAREISSKELDVVVTDGELPDGTAADVAGLFPELPRIALSGDSARCAELMRTHGFRAALVKPVAMRTLVETIHSVVPPGAA